MPQEKISILKTDTPDTKAAKAKRIREEFERVLPEMAELRRELIAQGMCKDNLSSIQRVLTDAIDYDAHRDNPQRAQAIWEKPPTYIPPPESNSAVSNQSRPVGWRPTKPSHERSVRGRGPSKGPRH